MNIERQIIMLNNQYLKEQNEKLIKNASRLELEMNPFYIQLVRERDRLVVLLDNMQPILRDYRKFLIEEQNKRTTKSIVNKIKSYWE